MTDIRDGVEQTGLTAAAITAIWAAQVIYTWQGYEEADSQVPPVAGTWYTIFDESDGVKVECVALLFDEDEEGGATYEVRTTMDGLIRTSIPLGATWGVPALIHMAIMAPAETTLVAQPRGTDSIEIGHFGWGNDGFGVPSDAVGGDYIERHDIKIEVRQTSAVGTNAGIYWLISYALLEAIP